MPFVAVAVLQYGGSAAEGIISGAIDVSNITPAQKYTYWVRDRDAKPDEQPSKNATKFKNALKKAGLACHILEKREIEFYYSREVLRAAQGGITEDEKVVEDILEGDQSEKFTKIASGVCVPRGKTLRKLLQEHVLCKDQLNEEIKGIVARLIAWKKEILGE